MNNAVNNPKTLSRLWAALYCDFESLLARFMGCPGWRYIHFAKICREMEITLIMHITQGRGKTKDEHYYRITDMILQMAKELWLRTAESISNSNQEFVPQQERSLEDNSMEMKRQLGGFYLLYTMYEKQPIKDKVKIGMGVNDLAALHKFCREIEQLPFHAEVAFMLKYLEEKNSYHFCIFAEDFRFDASTRNFLNISKSDVVGLTRRMRDSQDVLAYSSVHERCDKSFKDLTIVKQCVAKDILKASNPKDVEKHLLPDSTYYGFMRAVNGDAMRTAMKNLDKILDKPVMTLHGLTATEAIDRRIMMETRRRMERARKKALQTQDRDGDNHKAIRPYVREGGIFGRKKETEEGEDKAKRRERGACNGNLWIFINGQDFYKPMSAGRGGSGDGDTPHGGDKKKEKGQGKRGRKGTGEGSGSESAPPPPEEVMVKHDFLEVDEEEDEDDKENEVDEEDAADEEEEVPMEEPEENYFEEELMDIVLKKGLTFDLTLN